MKSCVVLASPHVLTQNKQVKKVYKVHRPCPVSLDLKPPTQLWVYAYRRMYTMMLSDQPVCLYISS